MGNPAEGSRTDLARVGGAWGEERSEAMELIELASQKHPDVQTAEALVPLIYRLKQGAEV